MPKLTATFDAVDRMSEKFANMYESGSKAFKQWEQAGNIGNKAMGDVEKGAVTTAKALTNVSSQTDFWTDKIGTYNKEAMEFVYTTEELVEEGYKSADALEYEAEMAKKLADELDNLGDKREESYPGGDSPSGGGSPPGSPEFPETPPSPVPDPDPIDDSRQAMELYADTLAALGVAQMLTTIANAAMECVDAFQEYETGLAKVSTLADPSVKSMTEISSEIRSLSNEVGQYSSDIAEATYEAISAGVNTADAVEFVATANSLAVGGFTQNATAVDVLTTSINAYGLAVSDASQISDYLITTQNLGKTTVDELAGSVGRVIPIAAAYSVEMDNLSTAIAIMTANGIATAETMTYLKAMLTELGDSGSTVTQVLLDETGYSFAQLTEQGYSLGDVMAVLGDSVNNNSGAFNELWSSTEAGIGALSLMNSGAEKYNSVLNEMQNSAGAAEAAFNKMCDTSAFAEQKFLNSANNLKIAIGEDLSGAVNGLYAAGSGIMNGLTFVIDKCPVVTAGITGLTTSLATLTAGVVGYNTVVKIADVAQKAFNASAKANPYILAATAVVGLASAVAVLATNTNEANSEYESLTATSKKQYDEIRKLESEYEELCKVEKQNTYEAWALERQIDELTTSYENSKKTVEEYTAEVEKSIEETRKSREEYEETIDSLDNEYESSMALIGKLQELSNTSALAAKNQAAITPIIEELNSRYTGLGLTFDSLKGKFNLPIEEIRQIAATQYNARVEMEDWERYVELIGMIPTTQARVNEAVEELKTITSPEAAYEEFINYISGEGLRDILFLDLSGVIKASQKAQSDAKAYNNQATIVNTLKGNLKELKKELGELQEKYGLTETVMNTTSNVFANGAEAVTHYADQIKSLEQSYKDNYTAALEFIEAQYSVWEKVDSKTTVSVSSINSAMQSQIDYWNNYSNNLENLMGRDVEGLDEFIHSMNDGSEESAAAFAGMSKASDKQLEDMVAKWKKLEEAEQNAAATIADEKSGLSKFTDEVIIELEDTLEEMNMSEDAYDAAMETIKGYIKGVENSLPDVKAAFGKVQEAVFWSGYSEGKLNVSDLFRTPFASAGLGAAWTWQNGNGYASGTDNATPGWHLVGELGPEIVYFNGGETVYNAEETDKMLTNAENPFGNSEKTDRFVNIREESSSSSEKRVVLVIEGVGEIVVDKGVDKEAVIEILQSNIKPVLLNILEEEVFEEGEESYEY